MTLAESTLQVLSGSALLECAIIGSTQEHRSAPGPQLRGSNNAPDASQISLKWEIETQGKRTDRHRVQKI